MKFSIPSARLPGAIRHRLDAAVREIVRPEGGPWIDFTQPPGEEALAQPDSVSWRVFKNPVALYIGGATAVILELAEPRVRAGVWDHTSFRRDPLPRMRRTGLAAMVTVYGARSVAESMITGIGRMHERIRGVTASGIAYRANDPDLLNWVQATASFGFLEAYRTFVKPLAPEERDRFYGESRPAAQLYGAVDAPTTSAECDALFERMRSALEPSDTVFEFLEIMRRTTALSPALRPLQGVFLKAAVEITPPWVRDVLGLNGRWRLSRIESRFVKLAGAAADRTILDSSPAVEACRRMGLPPDYLYRES